MINSKNEETSLIKDATLLLAAVQRYSEMKGNQFQCIVDGQP